MIPVTWALNGIWHEKPRVIHKKACAPQSRSTSGYARKIAGASSRSGSPSSSSSCWRCTPCFAHASSIGRPCRFTSVRQRSTLCSTRASTYAAQHVFRHVFNMHSACSSTRARHAFDVCLNTCPQCVRHVVGTHSTGVLRFRHLFYSFGIRSTCVRHVFVLGMRSAHAFDKLADV